jgi:hypothetical protein
MAWLPKIQVYLTDCWVAPVLRWPDRACWYKIVFRRHRPRWALIIG